MNYYHIDFKGPVMTDGDIIDNKTLESLRIIRDKKPEWIWINTTIIPEIHTKEMLTKMYSKLFDIFGEIPIIDNKSQTILDRTAWLHTAIRTD
jgi:pyruvate-formate lyase-activating enzyme